MFDNHYKLEENSVFLSKEILAVFVAAWLGVNGWLFLTVVSQGTAIELILEKIHHIDNAVNDRMIGQPTLSETADQILELIKKEYENNS